MIALGWFHPNYTNANTYNMIQNSPEYKAAKELEQALNDYKWSPEQFAESTQFYHRTLQQRLMATLVAIIRRMGDDAYPIDPRNKAAHTLCKQIIDSGILDNTPLPLV